MADRHHVTVADLPTKPAGASAFAEAKARDAMRAGVLTCPPEAPLRVVARMMSSYRVHCIVVTEPVAEADSSEQPWRVISDLDLVRTAGRDFDETSAASFASEDALTVSTEDTVEQVASVMGKKGAAHVVVQDPQGRPVGVVSTMDVIDLLAATRG